MSSPLTEDQRRLQTLLEQEDRFMPTYHRLHNAGRLAHSEDEDRTRMLEIMHEVRTCTLYVHCMISWFYVSMARCVLDGKKPSGCFTFCIFRIIGAISGISFRWFSVGAE